MRQHYSAVCTALRVIARWGNEISWLYGNKRKYGTGFFISRWVYWPKSADLCQTETVLNNNGRSVAHVTGSSKTEKKNQLRLICFLQHVWMCREKIQVVIWVGGGGLLWVHYRTISRKTREPKNIPFELLPAFIIGQTISLSSVKPSPV